MSSFENVREINLEVTSWLDEKEVCQNLKCNKIIQNPIRIRINNIRHIFCHDCYDTIIQCHHFDERYKSKSCDDFSYIFQINTSKQTFNNACTRCWNRKTNILKLYKCIPSPHEEPRDIYLCEECEALLFPSHS